MGFQKVFLAREAAEDPAIRASRCCTRWLRAAWQVCSIVGRRSRAQDPSGNPQAREGPTMLPAPLPTSQIVDLLGQAAFSRAVQALDLKTGALVCLKIIKNNKDYFDQARAVWAPSGGPLSGRC